MRVSNIHAQKLLALSKPQFGSTTPGIYEDKGHQIDFSSFPGWEAFQGEATIGINIVLKPKVPVHKDEQVKIMVLPNALKLRPRDIGSMTVKGSVNVKLAEYPLEKFVVGKPSEQFNGTYVIAKKKDATAICKISSIGKTYWYAEYRANKDLTREEMRPIFAALTKVAVTQFPS